MFVWVVTSCVQLLVYMLRAINLADLFAIIFVLSDIIRMIQIYRH